VPILPSAAKTTAKLILPLGEADWLKSFAMWPKPLTQNVNVRLVFKTCLKSKQKALP